MEPADTRRTDGDARMRAVTARAGYMMGTNVDTGWSAEQAAAWEGLLELGRRLRRDAESVLEERHDLGVSMLGIMGRLERAPTRTLRQTDLAEAMGLSLSRISRVIDVLEKRELVKRVPCPSDARATNVTLTPAGRRRTATAQDTIHDFVQRAFLTRLDDDEIALLGRVFTRLITEDPPGPEPPVG